MLGVEHKIGIKKRIYLVALVSLAALIFPSIMFVGVLNQQQDLLNEIEARHFFRISSLSANQSSVSNHHARLVDLFAAPAGELDQRKFTRAARSILADLDGLAVDVSVGEARFDQRSDDARSYRRLIDQVRSYRNSVLTIAELASVDPEAAIKQLRTANQDYRRLTDTIHSLIRMSRESARIALAGARKQFRDRLFKFGGGIAVPIGILLVVGVLVLIGLSRDLKVLGKTMSEIAEGRDDVEIAGLERLDEIGEMARATEIFRDNIDRLEALDGREEKERALTSEINALLDQKHSVEGQVSSLTEDARNLALARDAAEAASRAKSEILAAVSYDIRTPMNGLVGMAGLMNDTSLSDRQREYVKAIEQSGEALLSVFNDLLDYSSLEAGQLALDIGEFDMIEMLENLPRLLRSDMEQEGLNIAFYVGQDVPQFVSGDSNRLAQAILYPLSVALKSPDNGVISIEVSMQQFEAAHPALRFDIIDHGETITAQSAEQFIQRAWEEKPYPARIGARPALGLTISECLAALMGGKFGYCRDNVDGRRYWLTAQLDMAEYAPHDWRAPTAQLFGKRGLVVHGNHASRDILCRQIQSWGVTTEHAIDGRSALARMARVQSDGAHIDFVVAGKNLEDMSVLAFLRAMRAAVDSEGIKAVLICQSGEAPDEHELESLDVAACLEGVLFPTHLLNALVGAPRQTMLDTPKSDPPLAADKTVSSEGKSEKTRILIADDNQMNQRLVAAMLNSPDYHVDLVANGAEALAAVKAMPYDVVLMDIQMPEMDGVTATKEIRALAGDVAKIPIIAITAYAMEGDREKYLSAGMDDYVAKPIEREELVEVIESLVNKPADVFQKPDTPSDDEISEVDETPPPTNEEEDNSATPSEAVSGS